MSSIRAESWDPKIIDEGYIAKGGKKIYIKKAEPFSDEFKRTREKLSKEIRKRMKRLSPMQKKVVKMYYFSIEPVTQVEIAKKLGISRTSVKEHLARAIKKLKIDTNSKKKRR